MKFGGLNIGKTNGGKNKGTAVPGDVNVEINGLEEQLKNQADNLKQSEATLDTLAGKLANPKNIVDTPVLPHGPLDELTVEPETDLFSQEVVVEEEIETEAEENTGPIKLVEVKINPASPQDEEAEAKVEAIIPPLEQKEEKAEPDSPPTPEKDAKLDLSKDSLSSLFAQDEEEENPLAGLMRSLPDITTGELLDDIKEIKGIIEDWQKK
jgi:hypothetical protein